MKAKQAKRPQRAKKPRTANRIGIAQINTNLGDFEGNLAKILEQISRAQSRYCDLLIFPESTIFGYHPFDLLERSDLVDKQLKALDKIHKKIPEGLGVILGVFTRNPKSKGRPYFNSAVFLERGKKPKQFNKQLLPTGDVFDEARFIENGSMKDNFFRFKGRAFFLTICEDIWAWPDEKGASQYPLNPLEDLKGKKVDLIINISASPFYPKKFAMRKKLAQKTASLLRAPFVYCNLVGAQDEIVFDGGSFIVNPNGKVLLQSRFFEEDFNVFDLEKSEGGLHPVDLDATAELRSALVMGIRDFCRKTGQDRVHLGLSGGIDSALVACLAVDALGPQKVLACYLPSQYNTAESEQLAEKLARNLGVEYLKIPIDSSYELIKSQLDSILKIKSFGIVHENLQSRLRGLLLMAISNHRQSLLLTTGNKSELASGYTTLYGDLCGGLAPIGDLTKQQVVALAKYYNKEQELVPHRIIDRPPSAELRPNQKDSDSLPDYGDLDASVVRIVEQAKEPKSKSDHWLLQKVMATEFKRWQAPPILKMSSHSFGRGRRWPIAFKR